jgi:thymidylate synthase
MKVVDYLPVERRLPDLQYRRILENILVCGVRSKSAHDEESLTILAPEAMHFDLSNGVPFVTERSFKGIWKSSVGELLAFINGARTLEGLREFGVSDRFWDRWVTPEKCAKRNLPAGDLGDGSYFIFNQFPTPEGPFNQIKAVVQQIKEFPHLRSHRVSNWFLPYLIRTKNGVQRTVVTPCHGDMYFRVLGDKLHLVMVQHKADLVVGVPSNMIQYSALLISMAHVTGYKAGTYHHVLIDAHIYLEPETQTTYAPDVVTQEQAVKIMLDREPKPFPKLELVDNAPTNIFDIRTEHFVLSEYEPHPVIKNITTAI